MSDFDERNYYEVQLEQKQLVLILLLMAGICVLFFFLGVYYAKGKEQAIAGRGGPDVSDPTPLEAPPGPDELETEEVSRFFESGEDRSEAPKEDFEGGRVVAESLPAEERPVPTPTPSPSPPPKTSTAPPKAVKVPPAVPGGKYVVQIAAVKDLDGANRSRNELVSKGFPAFISTDDSGAEPLYKIRVGPYDSRGTADEAKDGLRSQGYEGAFVSTGE